MPFAAAAIAVVYAAADVSLLPLMIRRRFRDACFFTPYCHAAALSLRYFRQLPRPLIALVFALIDCMLMPRAAGYRCARYARCRAIPPCFAIFRCHVTLLFIYVCFRRC